MTILLRRPFGASAGRDPLLRSYGLISLTALVITDRGGELSPVSLLHCRRSGRDFAKYAGRVITDAAVATVGEAERRDSSPAVELAGLFPLVVKIPGSQESAPDAVPQSSHHYHDPH